MRLFVNLIVGVLLGILFWQSGDEGSRVLDNWNLLFSILVHHMMTTMMLTVLTCKYLPVQHSPPRRVPDHNGSFLKPSSVRGDVSQKIRGS